MQKIKQIQQLINEKIQISPLTKLPFKHAHYPNIELWIKRDDLLHPLISGNKWRKLKHQIYHTFTNDYEGILSFGGCYSNHIHALANAGHLFEFATHGIIRGESQNANNATLSLAKELGMKLTFVNRQEYKQREQQNYLLELQEQFPRHFISPEGGSHPLALVGVSEMVNEILKQVSFTPDYICCPVGSGGTLAGIARSISEKTIALGISVLKSNHQLNSQVETLIDNDQKVNWNIEHNYHCGGYAKVSTELKHFCHLFEKNHHIPLEPIYTGKMFYAIHSMIDQGKFKDGTKIVLVHTGGLQGLAGLKERGLY